MKQGKNILSLCENRMRQSILFDRYYVFYMRQGKEKEKKREPFAGKKVEL